MKKCLGLALLAILLAFAFSLPAAAEETTTTTTTNINLEGLQSFTAATDFMSLPGYYRWQYHVATGTWITRTQARAAVVDQLGAQAVAGLPTETMVAGTTECLTGGAACTTCVTGMW